MGFEVAEEERTVAGTNGGDLLGVFLDKDHAIGETPDTARIPVVYLSHEIDASNLSPQTPAPILAKPFSRVDVERALLWMGRHYRHARPGGVSSDEATDTSLNPGQGEPGSGPAPEDRAY
jgi:hypothetical protein